MKKVISIALLTLSFVFPVTAHAAIEHELDKQQCRFNRSGNSPKSAGDLKGPCRACLEEKNAQLRAENERRQAGERAVREAEEKAFRENAAKDEAAREANKPSEVSLGFGQHTKIGSTNSLNNKSENSKDSLTEATKEAPKNTKTTGSPQPVVAPREGVHIGVQSISKPGHGPFDANGETVYGWDRAVNHETKKVIIGEIYQFKGEGPSRTSDRWDSFAKYLNKSGFKNIDTGKMYPSTGYNNNKNAIHDRDYEIQSSRRDGYEVTEVDYVWR